MLTIEQIKDIRMKGYLKRLFTDQSVTTYLGNAEDISYSLYTLFSNTTTWFYNELNNSADFVERYTILSGTLEIEWDCQKSMLYRGDVIDVKECSGVITCNTKSHVEILIEMTSSTFDKNFSEREIIQRDAKRIQEVDGYTYHHCSRIQDYSIELWKRMRTGLQDVAILSVGSYFHDIGKLAIPIEILNKTGKLTDDEWKVIKMHTNLGAEMMRNHELERIRKAAFIVEEHHERYDGKGYPCGLMGNEISIEASIVSVVDAFDAMTTDRVYRKALTYEDAVQEMKDGKGTQFHPQVVDEFLSMLEEKQNK